MPSGISGSEYGTEFEQEIITILVVDDIPEARENIKNMIVFEGDMKVVGLAGTGREGVAMAKELKPNIIIMDINMPDMDGIQATALITQAVPMTAVIMMSIQSDVDYLQRALLVGARFFLSKPVSTEDLYNTIRSVYAQQKVRAEQYRQMTTPSEVGRQKGRIALPFDGNDIAKGHIIIVYSAQGGAGCTTIAVNLAVNLRKEDYRVLLVDADLQFGDVSVFLDLRNKFTIVDIIPNVKNFDFDFFENIIVSHDSGLKVLVGPSRPAEAFIVEQDPTTVATILQKVSSNYDFIIVDTGHHLDETLGAIFDVADKIILVATPTLPGIRNSRFLLDELDQLGYPTEKTWLVLNKCSYQDDIKFLVHTDKIIKFLKKTIQVEIPYNRREALASISQGKPLVAPKNTENLSIARHINTLATALVKSLRKGSNHMVAPEEQPLTSNQFEIEEMRLKHYIASEKLRLAQINPLLLHVIEKLYKVAFSAAHDMRSPLGIALDSIDTTVCKDDERIVLADLSNQLKLCLQEANNFLNISLFEEGGADKQDAIALLRQMITSLKSIRSVELQIEPNEVLFLQARRTQLQLLFYNLLMIAHDWSDSNSFPRISLQNSSILITIIAKQLQGFDISQVGILGTTSGADRTGTRFYVIDRILRHIGGKLDIKSTSGEIRITIHLYPIEKAANSRVMMPSELQKQLLKFQDEISRVLTTELTNVQTAQIDETYIAIVVGFYREMTQHLHRAKAKLTSLSQSNLHDLEKKISRNIQYCELLVRNVILTATGLEGEHEKVNLYDLILGTIALLERKAIPARIELIIDVVPRELTFQTDKLGLQQVLMNLGRNAIDAIRHDGCIMFHSHLAGSRIHIDIIDTGPGIAEELQDRVFQLGFSTKSGGYGIGLHSVKSIVEELNGKIDFQTSNGFGTIMHIELLTGESND